MAVKLSAGEASRERRRCGRKSDSKVAVAWRLLARQGRQDLAAAGQANGTRSIIHGAEHSSSNRQSNLAQFFSGRSLSDVIHTIARKSDMRPALHTLHKFRTKRRTVDAQNEIGDVARTRL